MAWTLLNLDCTCYGKLEDGEVRPGISMSRLNLKSNEKAMSLKVQDWIRLIVTLRI